MQITKTFLNELDKANNAFEKKKSKGFNYFNIFDALGISGKENYHSAFIAYLLNQNAEHFQSVFAQKFIDKIRKEFIDSTKIPKNSLEVSNLKVTREALTDKIKANRRVDILLNFANSVHFIIENKIYANDQISQLYDYVENAHKEIGSKLSEQERANRIVFIYLHPQAEALPSELSLAKSPKARKKIWSIKDKFICDEKGVRKAYFYKIDYVWIKEWLQDCLKVLRKEANPSDENGLNKIIFGINQYLDILSRHINDDFKDENAVKDFILSHRKNTQMALALLRSKENDKLKEVVWQNWRGVCEEVVREFYEKIERKFKEEKIKINGENLICKLWKSASKTGWHLVFCDEKDSPIRFMFVFAQERADFKKPSLCLAWWFGCGSDEEKSKFEKLIKECEAFFKSNVGGGIYKYKAHYFKYFFGEEESGFAFANWIIENEGKAEDLFITKLKEFAENKAVQEAKNEAQKLLEKNGF